LGSWHCGRGRWQRWREKRQGSKGLLPGAVVSHESGPIPAALLQISACLRLLFRLFVSLKRYFLVPTLPCFLLPSTFPFYVSPVLAAQLLLFHSSPSFLGKLPSLPSSLFLGKIAVLGLPLPSDLHLFSVTPSALLPVTLAMSFPWDRLSGSLS